jgi:chemotaxis regulatin CheY-phosphate phosphatase CheZ
MATSGLIDLGELDYLQMEESLCSTARGRAFLRMRDRRTRVLVVDDWRRLAERFEKQIDRLGSGQGQGHAPAVVEAEAEGGERYTHLRILRHELQEMSSFIQQTRSEIAALRPADAGANRIMAATGELDAIVTATERATTEILNAAERIQELASRLHQPGVADESGLQEVAHGIESEVIEILTACSFQDITGQRTTKVVNTLRYIEQRVNTMIEIWGVDRSIVPAADASSSHRKMNDDRPDAHLLNGPSLGDGVDQASIDALFDTVSFDKPAPIVANDSPPAPVNGSAEIDQSDIDKLFG